MAVQRLTLLLLALCTGLHLGAAAAQDRRVQKQAVDWVVSLILPEAKPVDPTRLEAALRKRVTEQDRFTGTEGEKGILLLRIAGGTAMVTLMEAPIPGQELQNVCRFAWYWREACETVNDHKAHLLVVLMGTKLSKLNSAVLQTRIVAALMEESDAVAVYWGIALNSRKVFLERSAEVARDRPPTELWVDYRLGLDEVGRLSMSTDGLKEFNLMEIEAKDVTTPPQELYGLVQGMAAYLITKGPIIRDGDTVGASAKERIRVRHRPSYWRKGQRVYRLEFGR
jgi:Domain of unknown function (DUF4261)